MKEFYYKDGIRVSLFNLDHKSVPFHKHDAVSDIMYCAKGSINIELPDLGRKFNVKKGECFQIPVGTRHRFTNGENAGRDSRYVLMQLGDFNIHFERDHAGLAEKLSHVSIESNASSDVYVQGRKRDILLLAESFESHKPDELTDEENGDVVRALRELAEHGIEAVYPAETLV